MKQSEIDKIVIGDYLIYEKEILICTNVILTVKYDVDFVPVYCFELLYHNGNYKDGRDNVGIAIWDLPEMLELEASYIGKDTAEAKTLRMLHEAKV